MKKTITLILFLFASSINLNAQTINISVGLTGGSFIGFTDVSVGDFDLSSLSDEFAVSDGAGYYIGVLSDFRISKKISVQPELVYANIGGQGAVALPLMGKYYIKDKFNLQVGPQVDFIFNVPSIIDDYVKKVAYSVTFGTGYDISNRLSIQAKYSFGLTDRGEGDISGLINGFLGGFGTFSNITPSIKVNTLYIGGVYKLN